MCTSCHRPYGDTKLVKRDREEDLKARRPLGPREPGREGPCLFSLVLEKRRTAACRQSVLGLLLRVRTHSARSCATMFGQAAAALDRPRHL